MFAPLASMACSAGPCAMAYVCMDPDGQGCGGGQSLEKAAVLWPNPVGEFTVHPLAPGL